MVPSPGARAFGTLCSCSGSPPTYLNGCYQSYPGILLDPFRMATGVSQRVQPLVLLGGKRCVRFVSTMMPMISFFLYLDANVLAADSMAFLLE